MSKFVIEESFWDIFPDAAFAVIVAKGIENEGDNPRRTGPACAGMP